MNTTTDPLSILKSQFGYDSFWPLQEEIIGSVLDRQDCLALMPTGGGKSLCYQLPALIFEGVTLIVSPLIALMKDQVDALNADGIPARFINSSLSGAEIERVQGEVRAGQAKLLYAAPERLSANTFRRFLADIRLSLIAIDEAHCISEWGHEFRPDYRNLLGLRRAFPSVPVIALTATATERVQEDIIDQLGLAKGRIFRSSFKPAQSQLFSTAQGGLLVGAGVTPREAPGRVCNNLLLFPPGNRGPGPPTGQPGAFLHFPIMPACLKKRAGKRKTTSFGTGYA